MNRLRALIREIHRRSLWQVLGIYLVGSWLGYQVILGVTDGLSLPDWVPPLAFVLFVIGLPIVVATAFVNEGAPLLRPADPTLLPDLEPIMPLGDGGAATPAAQRPTLTWARALGAGIVAFLLLGVSAGGYTGLRQAGIGPMGSLIAKGALAADDVLLLADFGGAAEDSLLTSALTEALRIDLGQSRSVELAQPVQVRRALERMQRDPVTRLDETLAREVAMRENIKAVLAGDVRRLAGSWVVTARLVTAADGEELAAFRESASDSTALLAAVDRLSRKLRTRVGESLRDVRASEPLELVTTSSLDALRRYTQAVQLVAERRDSERALRLLEEAVAIDTAFAMAYRKLAAALSNEQGDRARMLDAATRAYRFSERLTENERLHATLAFELFVRGDIDAARAAGELLVERYPNDFAAVNNLGLLHGRRRDWERAAELYRRGAEMDTLVALGLTNYAIALMNLGRPDMADSVIDVYARRFPAGSPSLWKAVVTAARGDAGGALEAVVRALPDLPAGQQRIRGLRGAAWLALGTGRIAAAERYIEQLSRAHLADDNPYEYLLEAVGAAWMELRVRQRDPAAALARVDSALARQPLAALAPANRPYPQLVALHAEAGSPDRARALLQEYDAVMPLESRRASAHLDAAALGHIALAEQQWQEAVRQFQLAIELDECVRCHLDALSYAFERMAMPDSAVAYAALYVETPQAFAFEQDRFDLVRVLERLGRLYEESGEAQRAAAAWGRITEVWKDADPELQPRVRHAQQRVRALLGDGR